MYGPNEKVIIATNTLQNMNHDYKLDFWQRWHIENNFRFMILNKSRRVGWSFIEGLKGTIEAQDPSIYKYQKVFVSYGMRDAVGKISDARAAYMNIHPKWQKPLASDTKTQIEFWDEGRKSRSTLISIPNQSLRGFGTTNKVGGISLDEFAFHRDDRSVYESALPCLSRGGNICIGSTPLMKSGMFHEILTDKDTYDKYKRAEIPWWASSALCINVAEAIDLAPSMVTEERVKKYGTDIIVEIFNSLPLVSFLQEHECQFTDESDAFISMEMIMACTPRTDLKKGEYEQFQYKTLSEFLNGTILPNMCIGEDINGDWVFEDVEAPGYNPDVHGILYVGWDMGRRKDASIFTLLGHNPDTGKKHIWMSYELKNTPFDEQKEFLASVVDALPIQRIMIDGTGLGMDFGEWAEKQFPRYAESVNFTNETKEVMANQTYLAFQRKEAVLPMDRNLHADIHCIRKTVTMGKHSRYDGSTKDSHADRFWSLALAIMGISDNINNKRGRFYKERRERKDSKSVSRKSSRSIPSSGNDVLDSIRRQVIASNNRMRKKNGE